MDLSETHWIILTLTTVIFTSILVFIYSVAQNQQSKIRMCLIGQLTMPLTITLVFFWFYIFWDISGLQSSQPKSLDAINAKRYTELLLDTTKWLLITWLVVRFTGFLEQAIGLLAQNKNNHNTWIKLSIVRTIKWLIIIGIIVSLLKLYHVEHFVDSVFTTSAITTIIIGLAAKETLSNVLSGLVIIVNKPFKVGDYISSSDQSFRGRVEKIGLQSITIRTVNMLETHMPNNLFFTLSINNITNRSHYLMKLNISVRYQDYDKIKSICQLIRNYIANCPEVDHSKSSYVTFAELASCSLDIRVEFLTKHASKLEYYLFREEFLHHVISIVHDSGADFAFPTTTLDTPDLISQLARSTSSSTNEDMP